MREKRWFVRKGSDTGLERLRYGASAAAPTFPFAWDLYLELPPCRELLLGAAPRLTLELAWRTASARTLPWGSLLYSKPARALVPFLRARALLEP